MTQHSARVTWERGSDTFAGGRYSRAHRWQFDGGAIVKASASPANVPDGTADVAAVDPEEAFIASISSCHMLWFLALAARAGLVVKSYDDDAQGFLEACGNNSAFISRVILQPKVEFEGATVSAKMLAELHVEAHEKCFITNSIKTEVLIEPR